MPNSLKYIITAAALIVCGFIIGLSLRGCGENKPVETIVEKHDTILTISKSPTVIKDAKTKIKYVTRLVYIDSSNKYTDTIFKPFVLDSMLVTKPFISLLDTIIQKDTIRVCFLYPQNQFTLGIYYGRDTIGFSWYDTTKIVEKKRTFWDKIQDGALWFLGGVLMGGTGAAILTK